MFRKTHVLSMNKQICIAKILWISDTKSIFSIMFRMRISCLSLTWGFVFEFPSGSKMNVQWQAESRSAFIYAYSDRMK